MPVVQTWDWVNRRIYLAVANYDPIDIYREHRELRATDETVRQYYPMVKAIGGLPKGGGERFGNALQVLGGQTFENSIAIAKIIPLDGSGVNSLSGEIVTDNPDVDADPFDSSSLSNPPRIVTSPISVIQTVTTGSAVTEQDKTDIIDGVWSKTLP